ncbi:hypothetical protein A9Q74_06025 [Colwellia sp. 39_35_sub15_T18]|nr:hypothetical protein A9Q74_06025 [Colwellia sp. 39_35_sub15_T18]
MLPLILCFSILNSFSSLANNTSSISTMANVSSLVQDNKGFIWFAGQRGLTRFDGKQIISFSSNNQSWPLSFNWLHDVTLDGKHLLLATETDGLWRFNPETGQADKIFTDIERKSYYDVVSFQGSYFINAPDKLYRYHIDTKTISLIKDNIKISTLVHNNKHLYVASKKGLYQLNNLDSKNKLKQLLAEPILATVALSSGVIAIAKTHIYHFDHQGNKTTIESPHKIYAATKEYSSNNFFTISSQGIVSKFSGKTLEQLPHKFGDTNPVRARSFLHDSSGVLWVASSQGINQLTESTIKNIPKVFDISINANELALYNDEIIIGSYGAGLQNFNSPVFNNHVNEAFSKQGLSITNIETINGILYIATFDGLWRFNPETQQTAKLTFSDNDKLILKMEYKDNLLYFSTNHNGVYIYDLTNKSLIDHIAPEHGLSSAEIIDILPLDNDATWLATTAGIDIVINESKAIENLTLPSSSKVISLLEADNKIFASTLGDGIYAFNKQGVLLAQFGQGNRFSHMILVNDEVWVAGRPGLYRFNPRNYQLSMIENTEQYSFVGSTILHKNIVYASHYSGILSLDLAPQVQFNPKVYISKTTISGQSYLLNKTMSIASGNDVITLDLASLDFRPGAPKQFRYRLNNSTWNQINGNQLTLTGLASGEYHIEIMATNSLGQWSNFKAYTEIDVAFPWYWTPKIRLFYALLLFCVVGLIVWLLYLRSKSIAYIHDVLKNDINNYGKVSLQVKRKLTLVQDLINQDEVEQSKPLLAQCLDDLGNHQASPEPNTLDGKTLSIALPFFVNYLQHKYQVNLTYQLNVQDNSLNYELQADLYRIIFEAITCVVIKGSGRNFKVLLQVFKNKVWLNIYDDEQGFIHFDSKIKFDISMYYIRQIASKHKGSINTFHEQDNGSQLILSLPLEQNN